MWTVLDCITTEHDLGLVLLAAAVCVIAAVTAMRFYARVCAAGTIGGRTLWAALTGMAAGSGVWATHFIAMLAYSPGLPIQFDEIRTGASLLLVVAGMAAGFGLAGWLKKPAAYVLGGALTGLSIAGMHFTGIDAMQTLFVAWRWDFVVAAIAWSVLGSIATLFVSARCTRLSAWIAPPATLVVAVVGLHFTAMAGMIPTPDMSQALSPEFLNRKSMAVLVGAITILIVMGAGALAGIEAHGRKANIKNLDLAFQGVPSGLALFGPDGRLVLWNDAYARMVDVLMMKPFVGATRIDLFRQAAPVLAPHIASDEHVVWARRKAMERHGGLVQEWSTPAGDWYRTELSTLPDGSNITVLTDISAHKAATVAMAEARDRAEAANRAKSEFLANMSHEIRTPLNGVLGMAQVIEGDELSPAQRERIKVVRESGQALLGILNDLLDLSKVQAGKVELEVADTDVDHLVRTVAGAFEGAAAGRDLSLTVEVEPEAMGLWRADGLRLRQVLSNLVGNALKFTHEGGVSVRVVAEGGGLVFRVRDTGIGIPADALATLFEAFTQADATTTRRYGGTGLGLSISRDLVTLMGGSITVESEPGQGSCFTVAVPTTWVGPAPQAEAVATAEDHAAGGDLRILAAEDNLTNQLVLRSLLEPTGCDLVIVGDGQQAVEAAAAGAFDVILMDIQMPRLNGVEATLAIRAAEAAAGERPTPIVALSANVMAHQIEEYLQAGMNHWIAKPIEVDKLYAGLEMVLSAAEDERQVAAA
jgi:signal transduction histidine kinase/NO-binding membrane sensor protein with MHYT domain/AmiR/NasT family two-component response regulator